MVVWIRTSTENGRVNKSEQRMSIAFKKMCMWCTEVWKCLASQPNFLHCHFVGHMQTWWSEGCEKTLLEPKLAYGTCAIYRIPFEWFACKNMLDKLWYYCVSQTGRPHYQPVVNYTYWHMLETFKNWDIYNFKNVKTSKEDFDDIHNFLQDGIINNMS